MRKIAGENQIESKTKAKERYDKSVKKFAGKVGYYAWVKNELRTTKIDSFYKKPIKIIELLAKNNVILEGPNGERIRKHTDKLKVVPK